MVIDLALARGTLKHGPEFRGVVDPHMSGYCSNNGSKICFAFSRSFCIPLRVPVF